MRLLAETSTTSGGDTFFLFGFIVLGYILYCFPLALVFKKAGQTPWTAFIPILNIVVLCKTVGRPAWWVVLFFIPIVGFIISIVVYYDLARSFGHGGGFTVGLVLLSWVFLFILALNKDTYRGPAAATAQRRSDSPRTAMSSGVGEVVPFAIAIAVSPIPIIAVVLVLFSQRARRNGPSFLVGWAAGLLLLSSAGQVWYYLAGGATARERLNKLRQWLARHSNAVMGVLLDIFGVALIAQGKPSAT